MVESWRVWPQGEGVKRAQGSFGIQMCTGPKFAAST